MDKPRMKLARNPRRRKKDPTAMIGIALVVLAVLAIGSAIARGKPELAAKFAGPFSLVAGLAIAAAFAVRWLLIRAGLVVLAGSAGWVVLAAVLISTGAWNTITVMLNGGPTIGDKYLVDDPPGGTGGCPPGSTSYSTDGKTWHCA